jgi:Zn-dependent protease with chaperone function
MLQIILKILGLLFLMAGIIMVYDARLLTKKWFGFGDQNEASTGFKILGFIVCIIGAILVYFYR